MPVCTPGTLDYPGASIFFPTWDEFDTLENATGTSLAQQIGSTQIGTATLSLIYNGSVVQSRTTSLYAPYDFATLGFSGASNSSFSYWGTFAKNLVVNAPKRTWNSLTSSNGCLNQFFSNTASNLNPFTPSASSLAEPAASAISAFKFNSALVYAASRPNYLGGTGLLYPLKSGVFRSLVNSAQGVLEATPLIQLDLALGQALYSEYEAAKAGECQ